MQKAALLNPHRYSRAAPFQNLISNVLACIPDTTSPGMKWHPSHLRAEAKTALGCASRESHPSEDLSELPPLGWTGVPTLVLSSQDRSATICFLVGWTRSPPYLAAFVQSLHRWVLALPPMSLANSLSLHSTPTDVFPLLDILFSSCGEENIKYPLHL